VSIITTRAQRRQLERENAKKPVALDLVPRSNWPPGLGDRPGAPTKVWRSRDFLVQFYPEPPGCAGRLSVLRSALSGGRWQDGITWDELQRIKGEVGFGDAWAVEVFPPDSQVVNVANIRHLWLLERSPDYGWVDP
jgi:hypothetical protein